ncbi:MAG: hypothetical protein DHS20C11_31010 [Lysobacteraceae bacterium]|nr:MAG: hypothetical protein DHS20C11_31010 [Xanthomonadaceae bacterium]
MKMPLADVDQILEDSKPRPPAIGDVFVLFRVLKKMNLYVGNLPYSVGDQELRDAFSQFGEISRANVIMDRETGRSKGFGFVEMPNKAEAEEAISAMNDRDLDGRRVRVNEARPRDDSRRPPRR